jgi:polar amino acid transport system substrate-binding protein
LKYEHNFEEKLEMHSKTRYWRLSTNVRRTLVGVASGALVLFAVGAEAGPPKTVEAGKLNVALNGDMPMTGIEDGKLIGTDGTLMNRIAANLGLEVVPQLMEWAAEIQSTKQGKVDIMHGMMGWIPSRSEVMLLTDPIYYSGTFVVQKKSNSFSTTEDMMDRSVATVSGFTLVPELKTVEGIGEVKLYDTTDAALRDVLVGRADMAILDPPLIEYAIRQNPDWDIHQLPLTADPERYPILATKYNIIFGINPELEELHAAVNEEIAKIWADCANVESMKAFGMGDPSWFTPPDPNPRIGVDRSEDWVSPTAEHCY